jgi:rare lipoprotein A
MDLSYAAAVRLGVDRAGTARVELQALDGNGEPSLAVGAQAGRGGEDFPATAVARNDQPESAASRVQGGLRPGADAIIQVASFGEKANARRLADRLQDAGVDDVDLDHAEVAGADVWRVRVGPVRPAKLDGLMQRLQQLGLPNPRVLSQ